MQSLKPASRAVQQALRFIEQLRRDLNAHPERRPDLLAGGLDALLSEARARGYDFGPADLCRAHALDWQMRYRKFSD